tara:strand:- start:483 stop:722 length:240 start_codon:yes stop_codon:yes gene_type:complete
MRKLVTIILVLFTLSLSAQERSYEKCVKVTVEKLDHARVKVTENNKCTNVITVRSYLIMEWKKIQAEKRKNRKIKKIKK